MTIVKFSTHLTSNPIYNDQGVSFNVFFGEGPILCFTNRMNVVSYLTKMGLSIGDSIEMTATLLRAENDPNHPSSSILKVIHIEMLEYHHITDRKRKIDEIEADEKESTPIIKKKKTKENNTTSSMLSHSIEKEQTPPQHNENDAVTDHFVVKEFKGGFLEFHQALEQQIQYYKSQAVDSIMEDVIQELLTQLDRLWQLFGAIQNLSGEDEMVVIIRFIGAVKDMTLSLSNLVPKFEENNENKLHTVLLPTYIFEQYLSHSNK